MSPYAGEDPLSLAFALVFAILGGLIGLYIAWRMITELLEKRRLDAQALDPLAFAEHPEIQHRVDGLYVLRKSARESLERRLGRGSASFAALDVVDRSVAAGVSLAHEAIADDAKVTSLDDALALLDRCVGELESGHLDASPDALARALGHSEL